MTWHNIKNPDDDIRPVKIGLDAFARKLGLSSPGALVKIQHEWSQIVGDQIADHAQPVLIKKTTLLVEVSDRRWATQLKWTAGKIVDNLSQVVPEASIDAVEIRQVGG